MLKRKYSSLDIAKYFLSKIDESAGDTISNLKLQKLVYFAQGYYLAIHDKPLFAENIEAWIHGPVIPKLYHQYRQYGSEGIPKEKIVISRYDKGLIEYLDEIYNLFGCYSASQLRNMTHNTEPWIKTPQSEIIDTKKMSKYFKTMLK